MTGLKCQRCNQSWSIHTLWPDTFKFITRFCPNCIPLIASKMGDAPC